MELYLHSPTTTPQHGAQLKHRDNFTFYLYLTHTCYMSRPSHPPWIDYPNNIWWRLQIWSLSWCSFFPVSRSFLPLRSKCYPQHPVPKHPQSVLWLILFKHL